MSHTKPWWQEKFMWLVVGLPCSVVLACMATIAIVWMHPMPVIETPESPPGLSNLPQSSTSLSDQDTRYLPAMTARNQGVGVAPRSTR